MSDDIDRAPGCIILNRGQNQELVKELCEKLTPQSRERLLMALALHETSSAIKMLGSVQHLDCPEWTEEVEEILLALPINQLDRLRDLMKLLDAGIQRNMLPS